MILKAIYALFIGVLMVLFVGVGIQAFYPQPQYPRYPIILEKPTAGNSEQTPAQQKELARYQQQERAHQKELALYNRNVFIIALAFALVLLVIGLVFAEKLLILADGLLLGGLFTLGYAVGRGFATDDKFRFIAVSAGLVIALALGYVKFILPSIKAPAAKST